MASRPLSLELTATLRRRLDERFGARVTDVRLFGSQARGTAHEESDVDVLVLLRDPTHADKVSVFELSAEVGLEGGMTVSALVMSPEEFERLRALDARIARDIEREGIAP